MGQGQSNALKGFAEAKISVERSNLSYNAGEVIKGYVSVDVVKQFQITSIVVSFSGAIKTSVAYTSSSGDDGYSSASIAKQTVPLATLAVTVATFPNGLCEIGNYQFPFEFLIPSNLPSSYASLDNYASFDPLYKSSRDFFNANQWAVKYNVSMLCARKGVMKKNLVSTLPINVYQIPLQQPSYPPKVESVIPVTTCRCCESGDVSVAGSLNKTTYAWKEPILVQGGVINGSSKTVQNIEATLMQNIAWTAQGHQARRNIPLQKMVFSTPPVATSSGVGGSLFDGNTSGELPLQVQLNVPERCPETLGHSALTVSYEVELRCVTTKYTKNPKIKIPMDIVVMHGGPPQSSGVQSVQPQPQQLQTTSVGFGESSSDPSVSQGPPPPSYANASTFVNPSYKPEPNAMSSPGDVVVSMDAVELSPEDDIFAQSDLWMSKK